MLDTEPKRIGAARFKETCLDLLDHVPPEGIVVTKHGRPVARVVPYAAAPDVVIGSMAGAIRIRGDVLTTGVAWEAAADAEP